jgi:hypothetical protein
MADSWQAGSSGSLPSLSTPLNSNSVLPSQLTSFRSTLQLCSHCKKHPAWRSHDRCVQCRHGLSPVSDDVRLVALTGTEKATKLQAAYNLRFQDAQAHRSVIRTLIAHHCPGDYVDFRVGVHLALEKQRSPLNERRLFVEKPLVCTCGCLANETLGLRSPCEKSDCSLCRALRYGAQTLSCAGPLGDGIYMTETPNVSLGLGKGNVFVEVRAALGRCRWIDRAEDSRKLDDPRYHGVVLEEKKPASEGISQAIFFVPSSPLTVVISYFVEFD